MKRLLMIPLSVILALNVGCSTVGSNLFSIPAIESGRVVTVDKQEPVQADAMENLNEAISGYLAGSIGYKSIEGTVFETHELYGTQRIDGKLYAYLWSFTQEYVFENNKLVSGSGASMPVVVILEEDKDGQYTAVAFKTPKDGAQYASSIKELFPAEYQEKILTRTGANGLEQLVEQKALNYFRKTQNETVDSEDQSGVESEQQVTTSGYSKDGDILTGEGTYSGQIDNNSIEIGMDSAAGEPSYNAFRFSEDAAKNFETLGLKSGDKVKISYFRNGYDQLVITDILRVSK